MEYRHCLADRPESLPVEKKYKNKKNKKAAPKSRKKYIIIIIINITANDKFRYIQLDVIKKY